MEIEFRRVPKNWEHPRKENGKYRPLFEDSYKKNFEEWLEQKNKWDEGFQEDWSDERYGKWKEKEEKYKNMPFEKWQGPAPDSRDYMPEWEKEEKTHLMMYIITSGGIPISPAFKTAEKLAKWLVDNKVSTFTNEQWLSMIKSPGFSVSVIMLNGKIKSDVEDI